MGNDLFGGPILGGAFIRGGIYRGFYGIQFENKCLIEFFLPTSYTDLELDVRSNLVSRLERMTPISPLTNIDWNTLPKHMKTRNQTGLRRPCNILGLHPQNPYNNGGSSSSLFLEFFVLL